MNVSELEQLITAVAVTDRRTIGKADVDFWAAMAREGRWTLDTAMRALVQFRATRPGEWLEPGYLTQIIRDARRKAAATFEAPDVPDGISGREYPEWYRARLAEHVDRVMAGWCTGTPIPESSALEAMRAQRALTAGPDTSTCPPELREQIERDIAKAGRPQVMRVRPTGDELRREEARVEIATLRESQAEGKDEVA